MDQRYPLLLWKQETNIGQTEESWVYRTKIIRATVSKIQLPDTLKEGR